jgi:hypothetical protein
MNFDQVFYSNIMNAASTWLNANRAQVSDQFVNGFMHDYTIPSHNPMAQQNAMGLYNYVVNAAVQTTGMNANGQINGLNGQQMYDIVSRFVVEIFNRWRTQMAANQNRQMMGGNSGGAIFNPVNTAGSGIFGGGQQRSVFGQTPQAQGPGSHLSSDIPPRQPVQQPQAQPVAAVPVAPSKVYAPNPLDNLPDTGVEYSSTNAQPTWNKAKPKDNRIVISKRKDIKTQGEQYTVQAATLFHREIHDDPMQVARDFFKVVPDSVLGSVFFYSVNYNHLTVLNVPTDDFIAIQDKCRDLVEQNPGQLIHQQIIEKLKSMSFASYQAVATYLTQHINRALYLACRLTKDPTSIIQIEVFEDLNELLSSSFTHSVTLLSEGRFRLETIVANAIWNALVKNVSVMFQDDSDIPTHAIQSSPAFPYSMEGVYPNKFTIPVNGDGEVPDFLQRLREKELVNKTYLLSRRRVSITNVFGGKVLGALTSKPQMITTPVAPVLYRTESALQFTDPNNLDTRKVPPLTPYANEQQPVEQLEGYLANLDHAYENEVTSSDTYYAPSLPVDQTILCVQYGVDPLTYLQSIDVFTTIDPLNDGTKIILATKPVPALHVTE